MLPRRRYSDNCVRVGSPATRRGLAGSRAPARGSVDLTAPTTPSFAWALRLALQHPRGHSGALRRNMTGAHTCTVPCMGTQARFAASAWALRRTSQEQRGSHDTMGYLSDWALRLAYPQHQHSAARAQAGRGLTPPPKPTRVAHRTPYEQARKEA